MQRGSMPYLAPIDGLRAAAVLAVIVYHLRPAWLPGGFTGVDLFFVISGFVVSGAIPADGFAGVGGLLLRFYSRRAARILPALYACLLISSLLATLFIPYAWLSAAAEKTGRAAVIGTSNFVLARNAGDYFAPRAEYNVFTHTWSLGVEEQFYAIFPWLFLPWITGRRTLSAATFIAAMAVSLATAAIQSTHDQVDAFYLISARFWQLALGVLAFQAATRWTPGRGARWPAALAALCLATIGAGFFAAVPDRTPFPDSVLAAAAAAVLLALMRHGRAGALLAQGLALPPMIFLGRISYPLYLWHWPVIVLFRWTTGLQSAAACGAAVLLALAAASLSTRYLERPARQALSTGRVSPKRALAAAATLAALMCLLQPAVWQLRPFISLSTVARHKSDWYPDARTHLVSANGCIVRTAGINGLNISAQAVTRSGCAAPAMPTPALFVLGDSHAGAYADLLSDQVMTTGAPGFLYVEGGCAVLAMRPRGPTPCARFFAAALADIAGRLKPGDVIFLPGLRIPRITDEFAYFGPAAAQNAMAAADERRWRMADTAATLPLLRRLAASGAHVVLEAPKPVFGAPTFRCADWFDSANPICADGPTMPRDTIENLRAPVLAEFTAVTAAIPAVRVWDPLPLLCPGAVCNAYDGTRPLFFDGDHLSGHGNEKLSPGFRAFLASDLHR
jgi:peptidoglycan/LPS O-acetylase OafA/YrhL